MESLEVGHGRECITPPLGIRMVGYAERTEGAADVHDDLFVNAVVLKANGQTVALLAYDICLFSLEGAAAFKAAIEQETGLTAAQVFLNTSHTHAGPSLGWRGEEREDEVAYRGQVIEKSLAALRAAMAETAPAVFSAGEAPLDIGCNRREKMEDGRIGLGHNPDGPCLHEVTIWRFARAGKPDVILFSTPMHGTTLGADNLTISAEWMGRAVAYIEEEAPGLKAVFLQGCGADQDPYYAKEGAVRGSLEEVEQHGRAAAAAVKAALGSMRELDATPLRTVLRQVELAGKDDASEKRAMPLHGLRLGQAILLTLGCEAFVEFAMFGCQQSPAEESTLVLGYTDGNVGYLCTADAFETGGYEPDTSRVAPESEQVTKEAMKEVLAELAQ